MPLTYLGGQSVGSLNVGAVAAVGQLSPLIAAQLSVKAGLTAQVGMSIHTPDPAALLAALNQAISQITALLTAFPSASLSVSGGIAAQLSAISAMLTPAIALQTAFSGVFGLGGIHAWAYAGSAAGMGTSISTATATGLPGGAGPAAPVQALLVATELPSAWAALGTTLRVS